MALFFLAKMYARGRSDEEAGKEPGQTALNIGQREQ